MNYFAENVRGTWHEVCQSDIVREVYRSFQYLPWNHLHYFVLNFALDPLVGDEIIEYENIVLSTHFQTVDEKKLFALFDRFPDKRFLLIVDQDRQIKGIPKLSDCFSNVEVLPWITWHHQLDFVVKQIGINCPNAPQRLISCLSGRQDIHKRIVTAFVLRNFNTQDILCSWHGLPSSDPYWLGPDFCVPSPLKDLLHDACLDEARYLDDYLSWSRQGPMLDWQSPPFVDCLINVCLESQFNDVTQWRTHSFKIPGPMFTEKTWKPILAGQCFLPVGQNQSCTALAQHGISFDFLDDLSFDSLTEFDRLAAILDVLDQLRLADRDEIEKRCRTASVQNLDLIKSGDFTTSCDKHNESVLPFLSKWVEQT